MSITTKMELEEYLMKDHNQELVQKFIQYLDEQHFVSIDYEDFNKVMMYFRVFERMKFKKKKES